MAADITIKLERDGSGVNTIAYIEGADVCGSWCSTPEAALIDLMEVARKKWRTLGASTVKSMQEDGNTDLYVWLTRTFS